MGCAGCDASGFLICSSVNGISKTSLKLSICPTCRGRSGAYSSGPVVRGDRKSRKGPERKWKCMEYEALRNLQKARERSFVEGFSSNVFNPKMMLLHWLG